jgi:hypothetical protein
MFYYWSKGAPSDGDLDSYVITRMVVDPSFSVFPVFIRRSVIQIQDTVYSGSYSRCT